jgi:hypothetical protein
MIHDEVSRKELDCCCYPNNNACELSAPGAIKDLDQRYQEVKDDCKLAHLEIAEYG